MISRLVMQKFIIASLQILCILHKGSAQDFGYSGNLGPTHWAEKYSSCIGKHQSPIDISEQYVKLVKLEGLEFENFDEVPESATLTNNGHTVMMQIESTKMPEIRGGPLGGIYRFVQLHFHWGENDDEGSENTINNSSFPLELHMVFYKTNYGSFEAAVQHPDGLAVLSFLYKLSPTNNTNYNSMLSVFEAIEEPGTIVSVPEPSKLNSFLIKDRRQYFTYDGSLTTPPCSEVVIWIEFKTPIALAHDQLEMFRTLNNEEGKMTHNFRPTQPLYDRIIYFNAGDSTNDIDDNTIDGSSDDDRDSDVDFKSKTNLVQTNFGLTFFAALLPITCKLGF